jgi:hypothetical protein
MKFKDLVNGISAKFNMPAADSKKIAIFILDQFADLIEKKENFSSPKIRMIIRETSEKNLINKTTGEPKIIPAQTLGMIKLKLNPSKDI